MNAPSQPSAQIELLTMVMQRIERLSADSAWARIAGGHRGSMIKLLDHLQHTPDPSAEDLALLEFLIDKGLDLLARAARELGDPSLRINRNRTNTSDKAR